MNGTGGGLAPAGELLSATLENTTAALATGAGVDAETFRVHTPAVTAFQIATLPAGIMALGSVLSWCAKPPESVQARFQKLSAGLLIGAAIIDIFPLVKRHLYIDDEMTKGKPGGLLAAAIGFASAMLLMYGIRCVLDEDSDSEQEDSADEEDAQSPPAREVAVAPQSGESSDAESEDGGARATFRRPATVSSAPRFRRWNSQGLPSNVFSEQPSARRENSRSSKNGRIGQNSPVGKPATALIPWGLVIAVVVDSCVDGMLVGLSAAASQSSGLLLALATAIEMGFLGFSFATAVFAATRKRWAIWIVALPPLALLGAATGANAFTGAIKQSLVFEGVLAFSLIAVLFMVFEELLVEANESGGSEWYIGIFLYLGLAMSIALDVLI